MNAAETAQLNRRRAILAALLVAPSQMLVVPALREQVFMTGYQASLAQMRADCDWLADVGLVEYQNDVAILTDAGSDVVLGHTVFPGIKRGGA